MDNVNEKTDYILFTKSLEAKFVNINVLKYGDKEIYVVREKPDSKLEDKFNYIYSMLSENIWALSIYSALDKTLLKANQKYLDFFYSPYNNPQNTYGKQTNIFFSQWQNSIFEELWKKVLKTGKLQYLKEYRYDRFKTGVTYWDIIITPIKENGQVKYIVINMQEVTEKVLYREKLKEQTKAIELKNKQMEAILENIKEEGNDVIYEEDSNQYISKTLKYEETLSKQNRLLKNIMNNIHENMIVFDKYGDVLFADKISSEFVGNLIDSTKNYYNLVRTYDLDGKEITFKESHVFRILKGQIIKNQILYYELNGKRHYTIINGKPILNNKGEFLYGIFCRNDITEFSRKKQMLREAQEKLLKLEREKNESLKNALEMKDEFLSLISHEFRTPLNVINSAIQTLNLIYANEMTDKIKNYLGIIRQNTNRQLRLVNNILDITRANAGRIKINRKNIDIVCITKSIIESVYDFAYQKGINLTFVPSFINKIVALDEEKYERIILNLLSNAIKFTPKGNNIIVNLYSKGDNICIEVKDTGIGIPLDKIDIIFDKFGQVDSSLSRQAEGSGIGLSLVKKFVEAFGGSVSVKSEIEKGSTFTVLLPDYTIIEETNEKRAVDLMNNHIVQNTNIEFADIYL